MFTHFHLVRWVPWQNSAGLCTSWVTAKFSPYYQVIGNDADWPSDLDPVFFDHTVFGVGGSHAHHMAVGKKYILNSLKFTGGYIVKITTKCTVSLRSHYTRCQLCHIKSVGGVQFPEWLRGKGKVSFPLSWRLDDRTWRNSQRLTVRARVHLENMPNESHKHTNLQ